MTAARLSILVLLALAGCSTSPDPELPRPGWRGGDVSDDRVLRRAFEEVDQGPDGLAEEDF